MLVNAYGYSLDEINRLIREENAPYLTFNYYNRYEVIEEIEKTSWNGEQKVSIGENGNIIGYYETSVIRADERVNSCLFIHFKSSPYFNQEIASSDLALFIDSLYNDPNLRTINFMSIAENHANRTYLRWLDIYGGDRFLLPQYTRLKDGNFHDAWEYNIITKKGKQHAKNISVD